MSIPLQCVFSIGSGGSYVRKRRFKNIYKIFRKSFSHKLMNYELNLAPKNDKVKRHVILIFVFVFCGSKTCASFFIYIFFVVNKIRKKWNFVKRRRYNVGP